MKVIVTVKQVPDTSGKVAVNPDGTLDRASMQTIINPDDMNAVEAALALKDELGCKVVAFTMGPPPAEGMLRELMAMGVDEGVLITAREFGGSDTYATSQIIAAGIDTYGVEEDDIILAGRQAIDGDTAQVGPQVAEKLGLPQVTYAEEILEVREGALVIKRRLEHGTEVVECPIPAVVTVNASAAECRPRNAKRVMTCKFALAKSEIAAAPDSPAAKRAAAKEYLRIVEWAAADVDPDPAQLGLQGSPTKVKRIENVVFAAKEAKKLTAADNDINELMVELIASHTLG
mgnify:CR=1 FL=1